MQKKKKIPIIMIIAVSTQIAFSLALPIVGGLYLGRYIDSFLRTGHIFLIVGVLIGSSSSIYLVYKQVQAMSETQKQ